MSKDQNDPAPVRFMMAFRRLRDMIDDDENGLEELAERDDSIKKICLEVQGCAWPIERGMGRDRDRFVAPVDPKFIETWRIYEERYASALLGIWATDLLGGLIFDSPTQPKTSRFELEWESAADTANVKARAINEAISFAEEQASQEWRGFPEGFADDILAGIDEWSRLSEETGFRLSDIFRRRQLVPFVMIPSHVSQGHGSAEALSLLTHLRQANDAFIFGVPFACLALLRSVLEILLRKHYPSKLDDVHEGGAKFELKELIDNAVALPPTVSQTRLHRLRYLANDILHFERERIRMPRDMERETIWFLLDIRNLIERAPSRKR
ncbi:MAG: hypothetical protein WD005_06500 [Haliea sp.]